MELLTKHGDNRIEIKSFGNRHAVIKGYGVVFQGRDVVGDTFIKQTQFNTNRIIGTPVFLEHTLEGYTQQIGEVTGYGIDDFGMWIEAKVDTSIKIVSEYIEKIRKGLVGWSSGATSHLVERVKNVITKWFIAEFSLTTHPADRRTLGVQQIKSLSPEMQLLLETRNNITLNTTIKINSRIGIRTGK
jgi:hypothetical protein